MDEVGGLFSLFQRVVPMVKWLINLFVWFSLNGIVIIPWSFICVTRFWSFWASFFHGVMIINSFGCSNFSSCLILVSFASVVFGSMLLLVHVVIMCWSSFVSRSSMLLSIHLVLIPLLCRSL